MRTSLFRAPLLVSVVIAVSLTACGQREGSINVVEATYGWNCKAFKVPAPYQNNVKVGNATAAVATACNGKEGSCAFTVDVQKIGDPANGCGKDFTVQFQCGRNRDMRTAKLDGEAHTKSITLSCAKE